MKLNKNTGAKATIVGIAAALFAGLLALVHANPRIHAQPASTPQAQPTPDFDNFFRNSGGGRFQQTRPQPQAQQPSITQVQPHTRTRAS